MCSVNPSCGQKSLHGMVLYGLYSWVAALQSSRGPMHRWMSWSSSFQGLHGRVLRFWHLLSRLPIVSWSHDSDSIWCSVSEQWETSHQRLRFPCSSPIWPSPSGVLSWPFVIAWSLSLRLKLRWRSKDYVCIDTIHNPASDWSPYRYLNWYECDAVHALRGWQKLRLDHPGNVLRCRLVRSHGYSILHLRRRHHVERWSFEATDRFC